MRKFLVLFVVASVFGISGLSALCTDYYCGGISFSIGYRYADHNAQGAHINDQNIGYIGFGARFATPQELLQLVANYRGNASIRGRSKVTGLPDDVAGTNSGGGFDDASVKLGVNLASQEVPFYVNVFAAADNYSTRIKEDGVDVKVPYFGVELDGKFPAGTGNNIEWSLGYGYALKDSVEYRFINSDPAKAQGHIIRASLALAMLEGRQEVQAFLRLVGKYQMLDASTSTNYGATPTAISYPATKNAQAMVEVGFKF